MLGVRRFAAASLFAFSFVFLLAAPAEAQIGPPRGGYPPCYPECEVEVVIEPGTSTVYSPALDVDVTFCGEANLNASSRLIKLRGTDVTSDFTFTTGGPSAPSVFQTTPPQPASKARRTLYSLSVGGAEASQKGFGDLTPAMSQRRSAMLASLLSGSQ